MLSNILDGKKLAETIINQVGLEIQNRSNAGISPPNISVILVGKDPRSNIYVKNKLIACNRVGIQCNFLHLPQDITEKELLGIISKLNQDININAILIQLPLPANITLSKIFTSIDPNKDVDGFHPYNLGLLAQGWPRLQPCTPQGIMKMLVSTNIDLAGKRAVVVGASNIVGKPTTMCLSNAGCTVTICNHHTKNLSAIVVTADIVVAAAGKPHLIKGDWIKPDSIVIDVGITKINNTIVGDVDFIEASKRAAWISKVPGGVGPMTVACLLENILIAQKLQQPNFNQ